MKAKKLSAAIFFGWLVLFGVVSVRAATWTWAAGTTGNWSDTTLWTPTTVPGGAGNIAQQTSTATPNPSATLDTNIVIGQIKNTIASGRVWTINSDGVHVLTMDNTGGSANLFGDSNAALSSTSSGQLIVNPSIVIQNTDLDIGYPTYNAANNITMVIGASSANTITATSARNLNLFAGLAGATKGLTINSTIGGSGSNITVRNQTTGGTGNVTLASVVGPNAGIVQNSTSAKLLLNAPNTYTGGTVITAGTLQLGVANAIPSGSSVSVTGTLNLAGFSDTIDGLSGVGVVDGTSGTPVLTVGGNNSGGVFSGVIQNSGGTLSLIKIGSGTQTLSGANTYTGGTTVSNGSLLVNNTSGSGTGAGAVTVNTNSILGGGGIITGGVTVNNGGNFSPGAGTNVAGTVLAISNTLTLAAGSFTILKVQTGSTGDGTVSSGTLTYGGTLTVTNIGAPLIPGDTFKLFTAANYAGSFSIIILPTLDAGLLWTNTLSSNGTIAVISGAIVLPVVTNLPATSIVVTGATLNGQVVSIGGQIPTVTLYYGLTDGGTNAGAWSNSISLGTKPAGNFSNVLASLSATTTYYYTAAGMNSAGTTWAAPSQSFTTPAVSLAVITNLPATSVQGTKATLNGQIVSTGGQAPGVTLYYGLTDGGTNVANWGNSVALGLQSSGSFSNTITGLITNKTYYYTAAATNSAGVAWASPSRSFTTPALPVITNLSATSVQGTAATLNGQIILTGGQTPNVILYYGLTDGGTNAANWVNSVFLGSQGGSFSYAAIGLITNKTYYYAAAATNSAGIAWAVPSQSFTTLASSGVSLVSVLTYHNNNSRTGANTNETLLTPANVNTNSFGRLFTNNVDGYIFAQPLYVPNLSIPGQGTHNVVFVATANDSVYAFDADGNAGANGGLLWFTNLGVAAVSPSPEYGARYHPGVGNTDISPSEGIISTPVIDPDTGTIYFAVFTREVVLGVSTNYIHRIHALNLTNGMERSFSPMVVAATFPGTGVDSVNGVVTFSAIQHMARPAMTLAGGVLYVCFGSHADTNPYHGWVMGYNPATLQQLTNYVFNTTPNATTAVFGGNAAEGAIWMSGDGLCVDANTNLYFEVANGSFDANTGGGNYADSFIKFAPTNLASPFAVADYFTPSNQAALQSSDQDLGSGGALLLPDEVGSAAHPHLIVGSAKTRQLYLVDRDNMGKYNGATGTNRIVQEFLSGTGGSCYSTPAYFNYTLYYAYAKGNNMYAYSITNGHITPTPLSKSAASFSGFGTTPSVSANGTSNGIVWVIDPSTTQNNGNGPAVLRAYNATNLTTELYDSSQLGNQPTSRDFPGNAVKYAVPTVASGKVYVGAQYVLSVYGLTTFVATPVIVPSGGAYANSQLVTLSEATPGATIYYTLDGSVPTTNSVVYTGPFVITTTLNLEALAVKAGAANSGVAVASFVNTAAVGNGVGLLGQYWTNTSAATFTNLSFNTPATLTRTDLVVNFNWTTNGPAGSIGKTNYTVRWTGSVQAQYDESYTFSTIADDGVRLWVNGQLLVNDWNAHTSPATNSGTISLNAQQLYNVRLEYFQGTSNAVAQLQWSSPSTAQAIIPQTQLYPYTNPPPVVLLTSPSGGATNYTAAASVTLAADTDAPYNPVRAVGFYANGSLLGTLSNNIYGPFHAVLTATGLAAGNYALTAVAVDGSGLSSTSAAVNITVATASGQPYGLTTNAPVAAFLNMPTTSFGTLPPLLSGTGAFGNTTNRTAANGLIPYAPNTPLWSDAAVKSRFMAVPNNGGLLTPDEQIQFRPTNSWTFPAGTVFVKNFDLVVNETNASVPLRRLETRLLVRDINGAVYGVTYKWRADNSDADLLSGSLTENILITNATGVRTQAWYYPSPQDCLTCHTPVANYVLGLNTRQLNGSQTYPATGNTDNQLRTLNRLGLFNPAFDEAGITNFKKLSALTNLSASLEERARSYLDANCVQCHQPGGAGITFDARYDTPLASQNITNYPAAVTLGLDNACIVKAKDIWRSVSYARMNSVDPNLKMPPLARSLVDTNALQVFNDWINSLPGIPALAPPLITPNGGTFGPNVSVTLTPPDGAAQLYYTLNGTLPTTNSLLYGGPLLLTNSATLTASAYETNYNNSIGVSAAFTVQAAAYFTGSSFLPGGQFQLGLAGVPGKTYVLQASTNLTDWTPLSTNTATTNTFNLTDPGAPTFPRRFYRLMEQ